MVEKPRVQEGPASSPLLPCLSPAPSLPLPSPPLPKDTVVDESSVGDWWSYMTAWEQEQALAYAGQWYKDHGKSPNQDWRAVFAVGQTATTHATTSQLGSDGTVRMMCYTKGGTRRLWVPARKRWVTGREKLMSMGMPITREAAEVARVAIFDCTTDRKWHSRAGNGMVVPNVGLVLAAVLSSVCWSTTPSSENHTGGAGQGTGAGGLRVCDCLLVSCQSCKAWTTPAPPCSNLSRYCRSLILIQFWSCRLEGVDLRLLACLLPTC